MIDPANVALFIPPELKKFKKKLFERIGEKIGRVVRNDAMRLLDLPPDIVPIVGCSPYLRPIVDGWIKTRRRWIYWDRGYARRVFASDLPHGANGGYYRWHIGSYQLRSITPRPMDRWKSLDVPLVPWRKNGRHIVVAEPSETYQRFHAIEGWTQRTVAALKAVTDRPIVTRDKEQQQFGRKLHVDLANAHCLVTHGSNAAVEAVIMGCPVFVHPDSAASLVGLTDIRHIENPIYPDRDPWLACLAYSQFNENELVDGTLWRLIS